nr:uncharacterized protein LOC117275505 [Nicotiana tomentosiformis]
MTVKNVADPIDLFIEEKNQEVDEFLEVEDKIDDDSDLDDKTPMKISLRGKKFIYDPSQKIKFVKGDLFTSVDAFRDALKDYAIQEGMTLMRIKNEKSRCTVKCLLSGCSWRIHASPLPDGITYKTKSLKDEHGYTRDGDKIDEANSTWIAKKMQLWRAKCKALEEIEGSHKESYGNLAKYAEMFRESNPGRMDYWEDVDPLLVLMVVIKGPYGGVLLLAVALDANNGLFPVAFAIVESEQNETWRWFFYWLNNFVGAWPRDKPWTFMSDRKKGLHQAYEEIIPFVSGRYCARHIYMPTSRHNTQDSF